MERIKQTRHTSEITHSQFVPSSASCQGLITASRLSLNKEALFVLELYAGGGEIEIRSWQRGDGSQRA